MPNFFYIASTEEGKIRKGSVESPDKETLLKQLEKENLFVISIERKKPFFLKRLTSVFSLDKFGKISRMDKILFCRHLSILIKGGVNFHNGLSILKKGTTSRKMRKILDSISKSVETGQSIHSSLAEHPEIFDNFFCSTIRVGEEAGTLAENFEFLAIELQKKYELNKKVKGVMIYPAIVLGITFILGGFLTFYILPKITQLFQSFETDLPLATRILLQTVGIVQAQGLYIIIVIAILIVSFLIVIRIKSVRFVVHRIFLSLPIIGTLIINLNMGHFSRNLMILLKSGFHIVDALDITSDTLTNMVYKKKLKDLSMEARKGVPISTLLEKDSKIFPPISTGIISIGEKVGKLDDTLSYLANYYEGEVSATTKNLSTVLEPVLMVIIGLVVGGVSLAIISPVYQLIGIIG